MRDRLTPYSYQQLAKQRILDNPAYALLLDMSMGKTVSALLAIEDLMHNRLEISKVLVIAPLKVARDSWPDEMDKWDLFDRIDYVRVIGDKKKRVKALNTDSEIYLINRDNVIWLVDYYKKNWPFDMVVIDELSSFKSTKANRFKMLRKVRPFISRIVGLTGTPAPNGLIDLWPQIYLLDRGIHLGKTVSEYRRRYFSPGKGNGHITYEWILRSGMEDEIYKNIGDICMSMKSEEYLDMPDKVDRNILIDLPPNALKLYKQLKKELIIEFTDNNGDIVAGSSAVLSNKLLQLANGSVYDENKGIRAIHDAKLDALEEVVEEANGQSLLVLYWFKHDLERLKKRFPLARCLKTTQDMKDWNAGKIDMLLVHPASAGHGLNLQHGGHIAVWFSLVWSLELYQQTNARLYRNGQKSSVVTIIHLMARGSVDEQVIKVLKNKASKQDCLLEAVKAKVSEVF